jgi:hypothetical protein
MFDLATIFQPVIEGITGLFTNGLLGFISQLFGGLLG